jgi:hypothetical protein
MRTEGHREGGKYWILVLDRGDQDFLSVSTLRFRGKDVLTVFFSTFIVFLTIYTTLKK